MCVDCKCQLMTNSRGEYKFHWNWESGGWNSDWARDEKHLREVIKKRFSGDLDVNWKTVRRVTERENNEINYNSWLMTI